jgi:hypothetical protein
VRVGPPAVGGHDRLCVGEQLLGVILVPVGLHGEVGVLGVEHPPQRTPLPSGAPPGLVHVQRSRAAQHSQQIFMRLGEGQRGAGDDRVDRARADPGAKQLFVELDAIAARDAVAHRDCRHRRFEPRSEAAAGSLHGQRCALAPATVRTAHSLAAVLAHPDVDRWQLFNLMACRITHRDPLVLAEDVSAIAALRPVLDDLIDSPRRQNGRS